MKRPEVEGIAVDAQTRCAHYDSPLDIVAIKMPCCGRYFACKDCHDALSDHLLEPWPREGWSQRAVLCGACGKELTVEQYLASSSSCPACGAHFNPGCRLHDKDYFAGPGFEV